ncbi:hypothetical protein DWF04_005965 [Cereibacter sphaeroides f. sp. denitrificans]|nr:hypothetical protein DWF04_06230 [Cereibacter sphaeroides f. sp. denitrificans]
MTPEQPPRDKPRRMMSKKRLISEIAKHRAWIASEAEALREIEAAARDLAEINEEAAASLASAIEALTRIAK